MFSLYKLQAKVWFANIFNKIDFFMTFLFLMVLGSFITFSAGNNYGTDTALLLAKLNATLISSIVLLMVASSAINTFGISFFEMKESVLLKRIGATEITKFKAVGAFILWGMTSMLFLIGWMALIIGVCQIPFISDLTNGLLWVDGSVWISVNWAGVISSILITMISFYAIAFFFVSISKDSSSYQIISTFYYFLISFLGGAYTPNADVAWMNVIGMLSPLGWGRDLMEASMSGSNVFNFGGYDIAATINLNDFNPMINNQLYIDFVNGQVDLEIHDALQNLKDSPFGKIFSEYEIKPGVSGFFTQDMANSLTSAYQITKVESWDAIARFALPVVYGILAGAFSAKFFKWD